jgi:hypothetical protein
MKFLRSVAGYTGNNQVTNSETREELNILNRNDKKKNIPVKGL